MELTRRKNLNRLLKKSLYGLKQDGRLWSKLLSSKLFDLGFKHCTRDMCLYIEETDGNVTVVGVYVDNLLVTETLDDVVEQFFRQHGVA